MKKRYFIIYTIMFILMLSCCFVSYSQEALTIDNYYIKTDKLNTSLKFVAISDLHNKEFGKNNINLINAIKSQDPDFVTIVGDMVTDTSKECKPIITLLKQLTKSYTVYYVLGNHENTYYDSNGLVKNIKSTGAILLDDQMESFKINGEKVTVGGLSNFPYFEYDAPDYDNRDRHFLDSFIKQEKNTYSILLTHQPELYFWGLDKKDIDLMICGHTHGGLIRIPFVGGVVAPNQDWFPKYDMGYFSSGTCNMLITSGLGNELSVPRINNPPEICVVNIN